jgi:hypothetical protein
MDYEHSQAIMISFNLCVQAFLHVDGYMNIAMEQTEEYVNGQLKNKYGDDIIQNNGTLEDWIVMFCYHSTFCHAFFSLLV